MIRVHYETIRIKAHNKWFRELYNTKTVSASGVTYYSRMAGKELEEEIREKQLLSLLAFTNIFGEIGITLDAVKYIAKNIDMKYEDILELILQHEKGRVVNWYNNKIRTIDDVMKEGVFKSERIDEKIADAYSIRATKCSKEFYVTYRTKLQSFGSKHLPIGTSLGLYDYDYSEVYDLAVENKL